LKPLAASERPENEHGGRISKPTDRVNCGASICRASILSKQIFSFSLQARRLSAERRPKRLYARWRRKVERTSLTLPFDLGFDCEHEQIEKQSSGGIE
jgi:hypothetical protein